MRHGSSASPAAHGAAADNEKADDTDKPDAQHDIEKKRVALLFFHDYTSTLIACAYRSRT